MPKRHNQEIVALANDVSRWDARVHISTKTPRANIDIAMLQQHCCPGSLLRISIIRMHFLLSVQTCLLLLVFRRFSMCRDRT
jgi:hypothetical protein